MEQYIGITDIIQNLFTWHWSMIGWGCAFVFMCLLFTRLWKYTWGVALLINGIGWPCAMYAGFTGNWYIGWFAWVVPLSGTLFMRFLMEYAMNLPSIPDDNQESESLQ